MHLSNVMGSSTTFQFVSDVVHFSVCLSKEPNLQNDRRRRFSDWNTIDCIDFPLHLFQAELCLIDIGLATSRLNVPWTVADRSYWWWKWYIRCINHVCSCIDFMSNILIIDDAIFAMSWSFMRGWQTHIPQRGIKLSVHNTTSHSCGRWLKIYLEWIDSVAVFLCVSRKGHPSCWWLDYINIEAN